LVGKPERVKPLRRPGIDGRKLKWMVGGVDWIHLAQDKDQWWAVVNTVMNIQVT
jgi:hypothetical protein